MRLTLLTHDVRVLRTQTDTYTISIHCVRRIYASFAGCLAELCRAHFARCVYFMRGRVRASPETHILREEVRVRTISITCRGRTTHTRTRAYIWIVYIYNEIVRVRVNI